MYICVCIVPIQYCECADAVPYLLDAMGRRHTEMVNNYNSNNNHLNFGDKGVNYSHFDTNFGAFTTAFRSMVTALLFFAVAPNIG